MQFFFFILTTDEWLRESGKEEKEQLCNFPYLYHSFCGNLSSPNWQIWIGYSNFRSRFFFSAAKFKNSVATRFKDADIESKGSLITAIWANRYIVVQLRYDSLFYYTTKKKKDQRMSFWGRIRIHNLFGSKSVWICSACLHSLTAKQKCWHIFQSVFIWGRKNLWGAAKLDDNTWFLASLFLNGMTFTRCTLVCAKRFDEIFKVTYYKPKTMTAIEGWYQPAISYHCSTVTHFLDGIKPTQFNAVLAADMSRIQTPTQTGLMWIITVSVQCYLANQ